MNDKNAVKTMISDLISDGMSQAEISRETGIPKPNISRIMHGRQSQVVYSLGKNLERLVCSRRKNRRKPA